MCHAEREPHTHGGTTHACMHASPCTRALPPNKAVINWCNVWTAVGWESHASRVVSRCVHVARAVPRSVGVRPGKSHSHEGDSCGARTLRPQAPDIHAHKRSLARHARQGGKRQAGRPAGRQAHASKNCTYMDVSGHVWQVTAKDRRHDELHAAHQRAVWYRRAGTRAGLAGSQQHVHGHGHAGCLPASLPAPRVLGAQGSRRRRGHSAPRRPHTPRGRPSSPQLHRRQRARHAVDVAASCRAVRARCRAAARRRRRPPPLAVHHVVSCQVGVVGVDHKLAARLRRGSGGRRAALSSCCAAGAGRQAAGAARRGAARRCSCR